MHAPHAQAHDAKLRARFVDDAVATASPSRLLVLLYDRLLLDLRQAAGALPTDRCEANRLLAHAQDIVLELRSALDVSAWDGGPGLASLYAFLVAEIGRAVVSADVDRVQTCVRLVAPLRDAWREAATLAASASASAPAA